MKMKHFTITTTAHVEALRPFNATPSHHLKVGHIVTPEAGAVDHTAWAEYPESDALTFEECMAIVRDEVTDAVMEELGGNGNFLNLSMKWQIYIDSPNAIELQQIEGDKVTSQIIENMTATKLRTLVQILRGQL